MHFSAHFLSMKLLFLVGPRELPFFSAIAAHKGCSTMNAGAKAWLILPETSISQPRNDMGTDYMLKWHLSILVRFFPFSVCRWRVSTKKHPKFSPIFPVISLGHACAIRLLTDPVCALLEDVCFAPIISHLRKYGTKSSGASGGRQHLKLESKKCFFVCLSVCRSDYYRSFNAVTVDFSTVLAQMKAYLMALADVIAGKAEEKGEKYNSFGEVLMVRPSTNTLLR